MQCPEVPGWKNGAADDDCDSDLSVGINITRPQRIPIQHLLLSLRQSRQASGQQAAARRQSNEKRRRHRTEVVGSGGGPRRFRRELKNSHPRQHEAPDTRKKRVASPRVTVIMVVVAPKDIKTRAPRNQSSDKSTQKVP